MGVTLSIAGYESPVGADLDSLASLLFSKFCGQFKMVRDQIAPDGLETAATGILNYYHLAAGWPVPVERVIEELHNLGIETAEQVLCDTSRMFGCPVLRIEITHNPAASIEVAPEMHICEGNALLIERLIGEQPEAGWDVDVVLDTLSRTGSSKIAALVSAGSDITTPGGGRLISVGNSFDRVNRYAEGLETLATWAKAHGYSRLTMA
jgi:hypothetical protein